MIEKNPDFVKSVEVSINPFSGIMEKSREALRENNQSRAEFFRNVYTDRMANALKVFLKLFGTGKASIIYRHAPDYKRKLLPLCLFDYQFQDKSYSG